MRHQNQSKHTSFSSIDKVLPSRRDHLKKWTGFDSFTHHSFLKGCVSHLIVINNTKSAWAEYMNDCGSIAQYCSRHTWVVILGLYCLAISQCASKCIHSTHYGKIIQDCIILVSIFFLQTQTALNQQPYGELSMPALNNRLSAILLKLNPAQIPHQKH